MKARPTIFISGVSQEFRSFRDAVENEIEMKGCFAENQPGFPPDYRTVEEMLRRKLHDADAMIHIVGFRFGAEPNQRPDGAPRRSYTQIEFDIARAMGKPVYVFISADASVRDARNPEESVEDAEAAALQLAHRSAVQSSNHLYYSFRDLPELLKLVAEIPPVTAASFSADISRIVKYAPETLIGREAQLKLLDDAWMKVRRAETPRTHVLAFVALGGEGKTSLVAKWAAGLAHQGWPGCDAVFAWSFYSQGTRDQTAVSSDAFLAAALTFFGDTAMAGSAVGAFDKGRRLAQLVGERRALLFLDGVEPLQYAPTSPTPGELKDQGLAALLKGLATNSHGLCVVTTRYTLPDLRAWRQTTAPMIELPRLPSAAGVQLLRSLGVKTGSQAEFEKLVEDVDGHALTLQILGAFLARAHHGDIRRRDRVDIQKADATIQGGHAFRAMAAYVKWLESGDGVSSASEPARGAGRQGGFWSWLFGGQPRSRRSSESQRELALLRLLGLFDRPATADCMEALRRAPAIPGLTEPLVDVAQDDWELSLSALREAKLLTVHRAEGTGELLALDAHPLLREYFARRLRDGQPVTWRAAHERLYEHLCMNTKEGTAPMLDELEPLYQAVAHGCQAGLFQEACDAVYGARLQRGQEAYTTKKLGALGSDLGAIICFFDQPWNRLWPALTDSTQAWLLNEAAYTLRALGRLSEALEPSRAGLKRRIEAEHWNGAAVGAGNLSQLELILGEVAAAERDAAQAVIYADRTGEAFHQMTKRTGHGHALHQAGRLEDAETRFREAEQIQAALQPDYPLLYSLQGFYYCDLLLAGAESASWKAMAQRRATTHYPRALLDTCLRVQTRTAQTLIWGIAAKSDLLSIALEHLTMCRAVLYAAILSGSSPGECRLLIESAVSGLRSAGTTHHIPRGLLTRAGLRALEGARTGPGSAQEDLDEAWEIAERGPMPLFLADIHLHRARIFFRETKYPWTSPPHDLAEARRLIEKHGYHRRDEELADAEAAILNVNQ
jgi:hypothetical protein